MDRLGMINMILDGQERTLKEKIIDKVLLLHILNKYKFDGKTKLHKAVFFAEKTSNEKKVKIFNFNFIRYNFGEYSNELQSDYRELVNDGLLLNVRPIEVSSDGKEALKRMEGFTLKNRFLLSSIEPIIEHIAEQPLDRVKEMAYNDVIIKGKKVKDIELGVHLLDKLNDAEAQTNVIMENKWIEKFASLLNIRIVSVRSANYDELDEDTKDEYMTVLRLMRPKVQRVLRKIGEYESSEAR